MFYFSLFLLLSYGFLATGMDQLRETQDAKSTANSNDLIVQKGNYFSDLGIQHPDFYQDELLNSYKKKFIGMKNEELAELPDKDLADTFKMLTLIACKERDGNVSDSKLRAKKRYVYDLIQKNPIAKSFLCGLDEDQSDDEKEKQFKDTPWMSYYERSKRNLQTESTIQASMEALDQRNSQVALSLNNLETQIQEAIKVLNSLKAEKEKMIAAAKNTKESLQDSFIIRSISREIRSGNKKNVTSILQNIQAEYSQNHSRLAGLNNQVDGYQEAVTRTGEIEVSEKLVNAKTERDNLLKVIEHQKKQIDDINFRLSKIDEPRQGLVGKVTNKAWNLFGYNKDTKNSSR